MRTHADMIHDAGGPAKVAKTMVDAGHKVTNEMTKAWKRLSSIPPGYWNAFVGAGFAELPELSQAAAQKLERSRKPSTAAPPPSSAVEAAPPSVCPSGGGAKVSSAFADTG